MALISSRFNWKVLQFTLPNVLPKSKIVSFSNCDVLLNPKKTVLKFPMHEAYFFTASSCCSEKKYEKPGFKITKVVTDEGVVEVKKRLYEERVTLLGPDESIQVLSLDEANKIARRRNLKLFKTVERDPKTSRPVYKLLTSAEFLEETKKEKKHKGGGAKDEKILNMNARITEHDLQSKIKHILKWLEKEHSVKVIISGDAENQSPAEEVFGMISESVNGTGRIVQKVCKNGEIKFQVLLPKKPKVKTAGSTSVESSDGDTLRESLDK